MVRPQINQQPPPINQQPPMNQQQPPFVTGDTNSQPENTNSPNHPLFLHQNDHPGLILISKKLLRSENYSSWRRSMKIALNAKNKLKIITKQYPEPNDTSPLRALWERNNDMIISWILNTKPHICVPTTVLENGRLNGARENRKRLIQFLMGLDESFANIRGQILLMQPLPNASKAYGRTGHLVVIAIIGMILTREEVPLDKDFIVVNPVNKGADSKPRVVNMAVGTDGASTSGKDLNDDATVFAKMDNLQNQLNQVMMMLQNSQGVCDRKIITAGRYFFIASIISHFKDAWGNNQKIAYGIQSNGLYIITSDSASPSPSTPSVNTICKDSHLWHLR
ncbi:cysteine-rich receptor-like protein kinase 8 [Tanacetum coccineum]|uniref:Cysteine-rich receptor-like protein kinase 8 n=1 Tax=Tanacetum coccineum TaxID=301880 RepID=A0ABQ5CYC2_9ASTR